MISETVLTWQRPLTWQQIMAAAIRDPEQLLARLNLPRELLPAAHTAAASFPLRVPEPFLARIKPGDPADPLLRQVLPLMEETLPVNGYSTDPVNDHAAMIAPGVLHKYAGRVLLVTTGACAIHCRYCFRRHFPYAEANPAATGWQATLDAIAADDSIREVILSGGDPMSLTDERLAEFITAAASIPHITRLRVHTRLPVVIPQRITRGLIEALTATRLQPVVVLHINHANEIDAALHAALIQLTRQGITLLNQAVLLRGVNDTLACQIALSERLFGCGILPYYLHQLDRVAGAAHFEVPAERARELHAQMRDSLPGYLLPRLVQEIPGMAAKLPL